MFLEWLDSMYCKELFGFRHGFIFPVDIILRFTSKKLTSDNFLMR